MGEEINAAIDIRYYFSLTRSPRIKRKSISNFNHQLQGIIVIAAAYTKES